MKVFGMGEHEKNCIGPEIRQAKFFMVRTEEKKMKKAMTREERYTMMIETPVSKLIPQLAVPTIISMLVTSIYNMADTFFVSQISTSASAAVGIIFSIMAMIQALGFMLGMGSGNCISRTLGSRDD